MDPAGSAPRSRVSSGYEKLDALLQGGFLSGSAVIVCAPPSDQVLNLLGGFLKAEPSGKNLFISRGASVRDALQVDSNQVTFLVCGERIQPSGNMLLGKGLENLTELSLDISDAVVKVKPNRLVIDLLSDLLLRHGPLQTRKWLSDQLSRLKSKGITALAVLNPSMHTPAETSSVADLFDGNLEIIEKEVDGMRGKYIRVSWMHGVTLKDREFPLLDLTSARLEPTQDQRRVAVLPFQSISPDPDDEYFADGLTEELISTMSRISGLKVIARTSVMVYKGGQKKVNEIARELDVDTVVEGSVRKAGNRLRVTVQLVDPRANDHMWAESYDRVLEDVFAIQGDIARSVAEALQARLSKSESDAIAKESTSSLEAYTLYLRALQLLHEGSAPSLKHAITLLEHAISKDPGFAQAYAVLSEVWTILSGHEEFLDAAAKAEAAARKSLELAPDSAEAHAAMARVHGNFDKFDQATSEAETAMQINPNLPEVYAVLSSLYLVQGRLDQALSAGRKWYELDPLSFSAETNLARYLRMAGRYSESIDVLSKAREFNPRNPRVYSGLADCYILSGGYAKAQEILDIGLQIDPNDHWLRQTQGELFARTGRRKEAEEVLQGILIDKDESNRLWGQLYICSALGDLDGAFKALMRMAETHGWPPIVKSHPLFEDLRKDPRFQEFCAKVGIPA